MNINKTIFDISIVFLIIGLISCTPDKEFPIESYYNYDSQLPLKDSIVETRQMAGFTIQKIEFESVHNKKVIALLSIPDNAKKRLPVIILMHGANDHKEVQYIEKGNKYFTENGYAVFRIDVDNHGVRKVDDIKFDMTNTYKYRARDIVTQTVFDVRRSIDYLSTRTEIDSLKIGYFGFSLGGIIGTVSASIDERIKVPVIGIAGGGLKLMFGAKALTQEANTYLSIIDPINFVANITPRPLLMLNSSDDDVMPPILSKNLFNEAEEPKKIIWYETGRHSLPLPEAYIDADGWYKDYFN